MSAKQYIDVSQQGLMYSGTTFLGVLDSACWMNPFDNDEMLYVFRGSHGQTLLLAVVITNIPSYRDCYMMGGCMVQDGTEQLIATGRGEEGWGLFLAHARMIHE